MRCPLTGKKYCSGPTRLDDCYACELGDTYEREQDEFEHDQWDEEYEEFLKSQKEADRK